MKKIAYNERAWSADVISEINQIVAQRPQTIKRAGGEWSVTKASEENTFFPDVLLFGDSTFSTILQGWELKMPDTKISDQALLKNARKKAEILGLNSFIVWNVVDANLYTREDGSWNCIKSWHLEGIDNRQDVQNKRDSWLNLLQDMIAYLSRYFSTGQPGGVKALPEQLNAAQETILRQCSGVLTDSLIQAGRSSATLRAKVEAWWQTAKHDYGETDIGKAYSFLATEIVLHWLHRFLFAHYLKKYCVFAQEVDNSDSVITPSNAESFFAELTRKHDFAQIFRNRLNIKNLPNQVWAAIISYNDLLKTMRIDDLEQSLLHETMRAVYESSRRKVAGQYCTPAELADLLVQLTVDDLNWDVLDPCCGTGTIPRAVIKQKVKHGIPVKNALKSVWASDKHVMPLQFATLALASTAVSHEVLHVFEQDVTSLKTDSCVTFIDPQSGNPIKEKIPLFPYIVSNLPFIRNELWMKDQPNLSDIKKFAVEKTGEVLDGRSDYLAYIAVHLARLVKDNGRVGLVFSNAWLATGWASVFRRILRKLFIVEAVVTSGKGLWFQDAKVVANLVILRKRPNEELITKDSHITSFAVLKQSMGSMDTEKTRKVASAIQLKDATIFSDLVKINNINSEDLCWFDSLGLNWSAHFTNLDWLRQVEQSLISASNLFKITRGERRGWDALFYPPSDCGVEQEYLYPVLKSSAKSERLVATPDGIAFCCSESLGDLRKKGHEGALEWIGRFGEAKNLKGKPLQESLKRAGLHWYEMSPATTADIALSINPDKRLFFIRLDSRSFVNQRLISFTGLGSNKVDIDLAHALLSSLLGCFFLEALGFGRGLGALDLSSTKMAKQMRMLNPDLIAKGGRKRIMTLFDRLKKRDVLNFEVEMQREDRLEFEKAVLASFNLEEVMPSVRKSVLELHQIRQSVHMGVQGK